MSSNSGTASARTDMVIRWAECPLPSRSSKGEANQTGAMKYCHQEGAKDTERFVTSNRREISW
ncbi:hypothetical protein D3C75_1340210 [compost metagenome]